MYYICYTHPEKGDVFETVSGEDAMQQRVYEIARELDLDEADVHVFNQEDEV